MSIIRHELQANCPPSRIWALLADLGAVQTYNPMVRSTRILGATSSGVGAVRECDLRPSGEVSERVIHWEEGRAIGFEVVKSEFPFHFMRWITCLEVSEQGCRITQDLEYQPKFGPLGWLLDRLVMRRKLRSNLDQVFAALIKGLAAK